MFGDEANPHRSLLDISYPIVEGNVRNWDDFSKIHDDMMAETRSIWQKFDQQLKHFEAKSPEPIPEDIKVFYLKFEPYRK